MKKILLFISLTCIIFTLKSQDLSFSCPRDTILGCNTACFVVKGRFPDLRSLATDYSFKEVSAGSACRPYVDPGGAGPSTSLTIDDTYSTPITLPFGFPFYGTTYNSLIVSTNGYVSFDVSKSGAFSHYGILNSGGALSPTTGNPGENLPSALYDRALIMGPYHDLNPGYTTSPTQKIKYNVIGTAPNRKWVLSFYKVPLFLTACQNLIENTHQIILHESTGVIEVFVKDKQICTGWNDGKAMIGLQDFTKTKGIMATGRKATDPAWGSIGMNETWRFIPLQGAPLYRSVVLLDATGTVVATGDTTRIDANTFETTFPNICPPAGNSLFVIKTTYQKIDDPTPGAVIYSLDTINVIRQASLPVTATMTPTTCGMNTGTITVTVAGGVAPYQYSIDGGPLQASNIFTGLASGPHTVFAQDAGGCNNTVIITVTSISSLPSTNIVTGTSCPGITNGSITVTPTAGTAPYTYTLNGGPAQASNIFSGLAPGAYAIVFTDVLGCTGSLNVNVAAGTAITSTSTTTATSCAGINNGTITITPTSGTAPYSFTIDGGPSQASNIFTGLTSGTHSIVITDANGCTGTRSVFVSTGSGITSTGLATATSCPGVNNGTITITPTSGTAPYTYSLDGAPAQASNIFTGVSAGLHTVTIRDANGCSGTRSITVLTGVGISGTAIATATSCPGVNNGTITVTPTTGTAPYNYALDGGPSQASNIFTAVASGSHTVVFQDANGCSGSALVTVNAGTGLSGTANAVNTSCPTVSNGTITVNPTTGTAPYQFSINGGPFQPSNIFTGLAPATYTLAFTDVIGCTGTTSATVIAGTNISSTVSQTDPPCSNINNGTITITPNSGTTPYMYSINGGPMQASNVFSGLAIGSYLISINDAIGCTGTNNATLVTNSPITTTVSMVMPLCNGNLNGTITLMPSGGVSPYDFSKNAGVTNQTSGIFTGLGAGIYTFRIRDFAGCAFDTTVTLSEPSLLTASAVNTLPASCDGNDGTITVTGTGGTAPLQYSFNNGTSYQAGNVFIAPAVGAYPNIKVKDVNGCIANAGTTVVLVDNMFLTLGNDTTICVGKSVTFQPQTNTGSSIYKWRPLYPLITLPATITNDTIKNAIATPLDTAIYILNARWGACFREDTIQVNILHKPVVSAGLDTAICNLTYAILRGSASNLSGTVNYAWTPAGTVEFPTDAVSVATPFTSQIYTLTVTDNYGCNFTVSDEVIVTVQPPVPAYAGHDTIAISAVAHQLYGTGGVSYLWAPAASLNFSTAQNPLATLNNDQLFILKVTDIAGCIGYDTVFVKVYEGPNYYVPNAFSPNGDGLNDIFRAIPVGIAKTDYFRVFNRYGQLLFETNQWLKGWDGTYKGKTQPFGAYVWIIKGIDKNGRVIEMKGTVMIVQ